MVPAATTPFDKRPRLIPLEAFLTVFGCLWTATGVVAFGLAIVLGRESLRHGLVGFGVMVVAFLVFGAFAVLRWGRYVGSLGAVPKGGTELDSGAAVTLLLHRGRTFVVIAAGLVWAVLFGTTIAGIEVSAGVTMLVLAMRTRAWERRTNWVVARGPRSGRYVRRHV
jgi:hypothetical protein